MVLSLTACNGCHDDSGTAGSSQSSMLLTSIDGGLNLLGEVTQLPLTAGDAAVSFLKFEGTPYQYLGNYSPTGHGLVFNSADNKFYGVLDGAGIDKVAMLMSYDPDTNKLTMLKSFVRKTYPDVTGVNGETLTFEQPYAFYRRPLLSPDGKALLLRTTVGGVDDRGVLIHVNIDPASANYLQDTIVYSFFAYEKAMGNYCNSLRTGGIDNSITEMTWGKDPSGNAVVYMGVNGITYNTDISTNPTEPKTCAPYTNEYGHHMDRINGRMFALRPSDAADLSKPWDYSSGYTPFDSRLELGRQTYWDTKKQAIRWTTAVIGGGEMTFYAADDGGPYLYWGVTEQCYRLHGMLPQDINGTSIALCSGLNGSDTIPDSPPRIFRYTSNDLLSQQAVFGGWYADRKFFRGATSSLMSRRLFVNGGDISDGCVNHVISGVGCKNPSTIEELDPVFGYFQNVLVTGDPVTTGVFFLGDPAVGGSIREPIADRYVVWLGANAKGYTGALNKYDRATAQTVSIPLDPTNGAHPDGRLLDLGNGQALGMLLSTPPVANTRAAPEYQGLGGYGGGAGFYPSEKGHFLLDLSTRKVISTTTQDGRIKEFSRERVKLADGTLWEAFDYYFSDTYYRAFNKLDPTTFKLTWVAEMQEDWSFPRDPFALAGRGSAALYLPFWKANVDKAKRYADVTLGCVRADNNVIFQSDPFGPAQAGTGNAHRIVYGATYSAANNAMYMATAKVGDGDLGTIFEIDKNIADANLCKAAPVVTALVTGLADVPSTKIEVVKSGALFYGTANGKLMQLDVAGKRAILVADLKGNSVASSKVKGYLSEASDNVVALVVYDYDIAGNNIARRLVTVNVRTAKVSSRDVTNLIGEFEPYPGVMRLN
jgi:hypothetical protein